MVEEAPPFNASVLQPIQSPSLLNSFQILPTSSLADFFPLIDNPILKDLSEVNPYFRKIKADGNSYYRAVYIAFIQMLLGLNDNGVAIKTLLKKILNSEGYYFTSKKNTDYNETSKPLLATYLFQLQQAVQKNPKDAMILFAKMVLFSSDFDRAMIKTMKNLVENLLENSWDLEINGREITDFIDLKRYKNMSEFLDKAVKPMNVEAHQAILHVLPMALRITIIHKYVSPERNQGKWQQVYPSDEDHTQSDGLNFHKNKIVLLFSNPAHFDLLYPQDYIDTNRILLHASDELLLKTYPSLEQLKKEEEKQEVKLSEDPEESQTKQPSQISKFSPKHNKTMPEIEIDNLPLNTERTKEGSDNLLLKLKKQPYSQRLPSRSNVTTPSSINQKIKPLKLLQSQGSRSFQPKKGSRSASRIERADSNFKVSQKVQIQLDSQKEVRPRGQSLGWWEWFSSFFSRPRRHQKQIQYQGDSEYQDSKAILVRSQRCYSGWVRTAQQIVVRSWTGCRDPCGEVLQVPDRVWKDWKVLDLSSLKNLNYLNGSFPSRCSSLLEVLAAVSVELEHPSHELNRDFQHFLLNSRSFSKSHSHQTQ